MKIKPAFPNIDGGLYRDEALFIVRYYSLSKLEELKKNLRKFIKTLGLDVTFEKDFLKVKFLDVSWT